MGIRVVISHRTETYQCSPKLFLADVLRSRHFEDSCFENLNTDLRGWRRDVKSVELSEKLRNRKSWLVAMNEELDNALNPSLICPILEHLLPPPFLLAITSRTYTIAIQVTVTSRSHSSIH